MTQTGDSKMERKQVNAHYGMLNDRFEGRSVRLRAMGFRWATSEIEGVPFAYFVRPMPGQPNRKQVILSSVVLMADEIVWQEKLSELNS